MLTFKRLIISDAGQVTQFIEEQMATVRDGFFFAPDADIIAMALQPDTGLSLGAFDNGRLAGIRLTYFPGLRKDNHGYDLEYPHDELLQVAQFHGTLIKDDRRYRGIGNELVKINCKDIFEAGHRIILVTVHPENEVSLKMVLRNGFEIKKLVTKYASLPRFILEKRRP